MKHHIYHHNDLDGRASGAIIALNLIKKGEPRENIIFYEINYGMPFDDSKVDYKKDQVYMVDFSIQPNEKMIELMKKCSANPLIWIDHHRTSVDLLKKTPIEDINFSGVVESGKKAGCLLTWEYFEKEQPSTALKMLSQYDVWDKHGEYDWQQCKELQVGIYANENKPENNLKIWEHLLIDDKENILTKILETSHILFKNNEKRQRAIGKQCMYEKEFAGYKAVIINHAEKGSSLFEATCNVNNYDIMVSYRFTKGEYWTVGMYSTNPDINCDAICKKLGHEGPFKSGGGHKGAAGFQTDTKHMMKLLGEL